MSALGETWCEAGAMAGRRMVEVRLAGCNLWSGESEDRVRGKGACARWCDAAFAAGQEWRAEELADAALRLWQTGPAAHLTAAGVPEPWAWLTGGEPTLQADEALCAALRARGFRVAVETNGTRACPAALQSDYLVVCPQLGSALEVLEADELRVVVPGVLPSSSGALLLRPLLVPRTGGGFRALGASADGWTAEDLARLADSGGWSRLYLAPQRGRDEAAAVDLARRLSRRDPRWSLLPRLAAPLTGGTR